MSLTTLDAGRAITLEKLCELFVPGSSSVGPVVYIDAVLTAMPPKVRAAALGELACDHAAACARSHHDDVEGVSHAIPRYDQSLARRVASGELKSISAHAPGPSLPGATKSL